MAVAIAIASLIWGLGNRNTIFVKAQILHTDPSISASYNGLGLYLTFLFYFL